MTREFPGVAPDGPFSHLEQVDWDMPGFVPTPAIRGIHALHWYPAPFPPALVGTLLDILGSGGRFLDPFCGSGVGPIEAWFRGYAAVGTDANAFAISLAEANCALLQTARADTGIAIGQAYAEYRAEHQTNAGVSEAMEQVGIQPEAAQWFDEEVIREIVVAKRWAYSAAPEEWRPALRVLLSSVLHSVSLLRHVHYTYIVDRSRTISPPPGKADFGKLFRAKIERVFRLSELARDQLVATGREFIRETPPRFLNVQAEEASRHINRGVDLVITSPPYFGMNDYVRSQYLTSLVDPWPSFEHDLSVELGSRRQRRSVRDLKHYLHGLDTAFGQVHELLRPGGLLVVVAGQSQSHLAVEYAPLDQLGRQIKERGFQLVWEKVRRVRFRKVNNVPHRSEVIWVFER